MYSGGGDGPREVGGKDGVVGVVEEVKGPKNARNVFPDLVWIQILKLLEENPMDVINASEVCTFLHDLLLEHLDVFKMAATLPLVLKHLNADADLHDLLNCRLICKKVTEAVDRTLDARQVLPCRVSVETVETAQRLHQFLEQYPGNMVGSDLYLLLDFGTNPLHLDQCMELLAACKHTLVSLLCLHQYNVDDLIEEYEFVRTIFRISPNLRKCLITVSGEFISHAILEEDVQQLADLERHIATHPLPVMKNLKALYFGGDYYLPASFYREIGRRYGNQLELFFSYQPSQDLGTPEPPPLFSALAHLTAFVEKEGLPDRQLFRIQAPKLDYLSLKYKDDGLNTEQNVYLTHAINYLQRYPTITSLSIEMRMGVRSGTTFKELFGTAQFPNVESLKLKSKLSRYSQPPLGFWFKLFPAVETLEVEIECDPDADDELLRRNQVYMFGCNKTELPPTLKNFQFSMSSSS